MSAGARLANGRAQADDILCRALKGLIEPNDLQRLGPLRPAADTDRSSPNVSNQSLGAARSLAPGKLPRAGGQILHLSATCAARARATRHSACKSERTCV